MLFREFSINRWANQVRRISLLRGATCVLALAGSAHAFATPFDTLQTVATSYNVFLLGNLGSSGSPYSADSMGAVAVAGNVFATAASFDSLGIGPNSLVVGGNLTQSGGTDTGSVYVGGTGSFTNGTTVVGSAATLTDNGAALTITGGATPPGGIIVSNATNVTVPVYMSGAVTKSGSISPPLDLFGTSTDLANASSSLGTLNATHVASSGGTITLTLTKNGLNVIDLSVTNGATINGITINVPNGVNPTGLILNVSGDNLTFNGGTFSLGPLNQHNVLFNFTNATNLSLKALAFEGSLLAPLANVSFTSGNIEGALIADNFTGSGEFHEFAFTTALPPFPGQTVAPEPGALALFATGLAGLSGLGLIRRRNRAPRSWA